MHDLKIHYMDVVTDEPQIGFVPHVVQTWGDYNELIVETRGTEDHPHGGMCLIFTRVSVIECEPCKVGKEE